MRTKVTLIIKAEDMPHGTLVMRTDFPPEEEFHFISAQDQDENKLYFLAEQSGKEGYIKSDFENISGDTDLDVHFAGLGEAIKFVKDHDIQNIW